MIKIYNRNTQKYDVENVAGGNYIKWCYESPVGKSLTELLIKKKLFSPVTVKKEFFQKLLDDYVKEYGLSGIRVFTDSQSFDLCDHPD